MDKPKIKFTKKALSTDEQIKILSDRGLVISDRDSAFRYLSTVSYYRLSAYFKPFQIYGDHDHNFKPDITFDRIWQIYVFDRELRLHISDALERIEIALRTALSDVMSIKYGNLWYISKKPFCERWISSKSKICAHHSRIWNRWFLYAPKHLNAFGNLSSPPNSFHMQAFIIHKLNESISPNSEWKERLHQLFNKYSDYVPFNLMGFLPNWESDPFWKI